jgi:hypothetical protein
VDTETPRPEKLVVDFDTTVNSSPTDISGKGNHGTFNGTDMNYSSADKAFVFNGTDDYIEGDVAGASGQYAHSVSLWYFTNDDPGDDYVYQLGDGSTNNSPSIQVNGTAGKMYVSFIGNYYEILLSSTVIAQKQWVHLAYSYDGSVTTSSSVSVYINGVKMSMTGPLGTSAGSALDLTSTKIHVGSGVNGSSPVNGKISNFKLYNVALEPSEVKKLYNLGRTGRSMVISDTAVGIGKVPEAQLDVRGVVGVRSGLIGQRGSIAFNGNYTNLFKAPVGSAFQVFISTKGAGGTYAVFAGTVDDNFSALLGGNNILGRFSNGYFQIKSSNSVEYTAYWNYIVYPFT